MPLQFPRVGVKRHDAFGVQVVSGPGSGIHIRCGISGTPISQVQVRIIRTGIPHSSSARLPGLPGPRVATWFPRRWNDVETPDLFPCFHIEGSDETASGALTAANAY